MTKHCNPFLLFTAAVALLAQGACAQTKAKPSAYEGTSEPPASDTIVTSPDTPVLPNEPVLVTRPATAPAPVRAVVPTTVVTPSAPAVQPVTHVYDPDASIVGDIPQNTQVALPHDTLEPSLYELSINPDAGLVKAPPARAGELETGTLIRVRLQQALSTANTEPGEPFTAIVMAPVLQLGKVIIPMGSEVKGRVVSVHPGKTLRSKATIRLRPDLVTMPDGSRYMLHAEVMQTEGGANKAGSEGTITPKSQLKRNAIEYGLGAGSGAVVGAEVAGGPGALVGSAIGAGVITVHLLLQNHQAQLAQDSVLILGLTEPMTFTAVQN